MSPMKKNQGLKSVETGPKGKKKPVAPVVPTRTKTKPSVPILEFPAPVSPAGDVIPPPIQKWCFVSTHVLTSNSPVPLYTLSPGNVVTVKQQNVRVSGSDASWAEVEYKYFEQRQKGSDIWDEKQVNGWVDELYLDIYNDPYPDEVVKIENATPNPYDARQFMTWPRGSEVRCNMCGELCVAYIVRKEIDSASTLESVLRNWEKGEKKGSYYYNLSTVKSGTYEGHLKNILQLPEYNYRDTDSILGYRDVLVKNGKLDWNCLKEQIKTHYFIAQVMIEGSHGTLVPRGGPGIRHWVAVEDVTHHGLRVKLYNPFPNKLQEYSFSEFVASCQLNLGLFVKRKSPISAEPVVPPPTPRLEVALDTAKPLSVPAVQYILREGGKKTNLCGEFSVAYILGKSAESTLSYWRSQPPTQMRELLTILKAYGCMRDNASDPRAFTIGAVLDYWREVQPDLYKHHVTGNQTTGPRELINILKAYGYENTADHPDNIVGFQRGLTDPVANNFLPSPGRIKKMLETHFFIAGVGIEGVFGKLKTKGPVRHWVVVERMEPVGKHYQTSHYGGNGGWVELYNPFTDVMEHYSYLEFTNAMNEYGFSDSSGFWVKRNVQPVFKRQERLLPVAESAGEMGAQQPKKNKPIEKWKVEKLDKVIRNKIKHAGENASAERIADQLLGSGWSRVELVNRINKLLPPAPVKPPAGDGSFETLLLQKLGIAKTAPTLPREVVQLVREQSGGDVVTAAQLFRALYNTGVLAVDANGAYSLREASEALAPLPPDTTVDDQGVEAKIADVIRPALAVRALEEIQKIRASTPIVPPGQPEDQKPPPVVQPAPPPRYRVMWDWERGDFNGIGPRRANMPCVFRCGEASDNENGHYVDLTEAWQFFWFDLCSKVYYGRYHKDLTEEEYEWLANKWTSLGATTTAFTNQKGLDKFRNYVLGERMNQELPKIYTLVCGGASLAGSPIYYQDAKNKKKNQWMLRVAHFDGTRPPPPVESIDPYTDPRVFFATTITKAAIKDKTFKGYEITIFDAKNNAPRKKKVIEGFKVNRFPQFMKEGGPADCPVPLIASRPIYYPMKYLAALEGGVKACPYFPEYLA